MWTLQDVQTGGAGLAELDSGSGLQGQDAVNFLNRYRPKQQTPAPAPAAAPTPTTGGGLQAATPTAPPPAPTAQQGQTSQTPVAPAGQPPQTIQGAYQQALMSRLTANPTPGSVQDDPALAAQSGAFKQAQSRGEARQRNALAERAAATGTLESGGFDAGVQQLGADRAFAEGQFDAGLIGQAREQRMNELFQALALAGNQLGEDERMQLQLELLELQRQQQADATRLGGRELDIREQGINAQNTLGQGDLSLRGELGRGQLGLGLLSTLLNDRQVNTGQGIQLGLGTAGLNQNAVLGLLQGTRS